VSAWSWPPTDDVHVYVTVMGSGEGLRRLCILRAGRDDSEEVDLPPGARKMTLRWSRQPPPTAWPGQDRFVPWLREWFGRQAPGK
jgi:hypothetical protein